MDSFDEWRRRLADTMEQRGDWPARAPWVRQAVGAAPRDRFVPERVWRWDGCAYVPVDRAVDPERWAAEVYGDPDAAVVTQVTDGLPSSSLSCEAVVVDMLDSLLLEPGHQVLELGTGTGRNAALLTWRAGGGRVTSVEVDGELAERARRRLRGFDVRVEVADGRDLAPVAVPYDRVIATFAVDEVPWSWVAATRPGGRIVTPWGRLGHVALDVADDGRSATGWIQGLAQFMPARGSGCARVSYQQIRAAAGGAVGAVRPVSRRLEPLRDDIHLRFALRVALPDVQITTAEDDDGLNAWLHDASSWAALSTVVHQGGPRRLANELDRVWERWLGDGSPSLYDYGMTVEPHRQYVWCGRPGSGAGW
ncbi:methyltransferase domain-containing protein [Streptomyces niveus]